MESIMRAILSLCLVVGVPALAACTDEDGNEIDLVPVCHALVKPYKYNTYKITSGRYAGKTLAFDLKQHNEIWQKLSCKQVLPKQ
jgi:hypothetical protein